MSSLPRDVIIFVLAIVLLVPWLNPVASGPSPSVYPWLIATACSVLLWVMRSRLTTRLVAWGWLAAALVSAALGLLQYFGLTHNFSGWVHSTALGDAFANLRQRNQFATLTGLGLTALLWFESQPLKPNAVHQQALIAGWLLSFLAALLLALGNAVSSSRTGALQWSLVVLLTVWWAPQRQGRPSIVAMMALAAYALATLALPVILEAWTGTPSGGLLARFTEGPGCSSRRVLWSNVLHLIAQKPWAGWGWGELDFAHFVTIYPSERFCDILDNAHNLPLHLAVELGLPVAIVSMALLAWWVWRNRPWAEKNPTRHMAWAVLAVIGLHSLLEYPLWYGPFQLAVGLCVLVLWRTRPARLAGAASGPPTKNPNHGSMILQWAIATLLLALLAAAAFDYWRASQLYKLPADRVATYKDNTMEKVRGTWFFQDQVQFAELTTVPLERSNAEQHSDQAKRLLHFSPEPRVIEAAIESSVMLGRDEEALYYLQRYKAAFPAEHAAWAARSARFKAP